MAIQIEEPRTVIANTSGPAPVLYRLSVEQFGRMIDAGVFGESDRVELLDGVLVKKMTKNDPHNCVIIQLGYLLRQLVAAGYTVTEEKSVVLSPRWRPEPDIAVALGSPQRYRTHVPSASDLLLLIEVADSSYATDREDKWRGYASAGVPQYWIVDLGNRHVEVYTRPEGDGQAAGYRDTVSFREDEDVPLTLEGQKFGKIAVKDILP